MSAIGLAYLRNILTQTQTQKAGSASSPHSVGESGLLVRPGGPRPSAGQTVGVETARPVTRANALGFVSDESRCRTRAALLPTPRASIYIIYSLYISPQKFSFPVRRRNTGFQTWDSSSTSYHGNSGVRNWQWQH